jgi:hypothetical protein
MQSIHVLPNDMELITLDTFQDEVSQNPDEQPVPKPDEQIIPSDQPPDMPGKSELVHRSSTVPDYDEVVIDSHGNIRERRVKVFSTKKAILNAIKTDPNFVNEPESDEFAFESSIESEQLNNVNKIKHFFADKEDLTPEQINGMPMYNPDEIKAAIKCVLAGQSLSETQQTIVDFLADDIE